MEAIEFFDGEMHDGGPLPTSDPSAAMEAIEFFDGEANRCRTAR